MYEALEVYSAYLDSKNSKIQYHETVRKFKWKSKKVDLLG